jgi:hypothetical protein
MSGAEIKAFLEENANHEEVKAFIAKNQLLVTAEIVDKWVETDEGKKWLQPREDKRVTEALKTYREGHYDADVKKGVDEKYLQLNPKETEDQKRIRALEEEGRKDKAKIAKQDLDGEVGKHLAEIKLAPWYVDVLPGNTMEEKKTWAAKIKAERDSDVLKLVNERLSTDSFKPGSGNGGAGTKPDASKLTLEQAMALEEKGELNALLR